MRIVSSAILCFLFSIATFAEDPQNRNPPVGAPDSSAAGQNAPAVHPGAITYSDAYQLRAKIHKYGSFATLPLFATEFALGQSLYNNPSNADTKKGLHAAVGTGIVGLFGVNSVTGIWNMVEDRHNSEGHKLRLIHGLLMLTANAGFVATAATAPHAEGRRFPASPSNRALHRDLALGSIGVGTIGYTLMLFRHK